MKGEKRENKYLISKVSTAKEKEVIIIASYDMYSSTLRCTLFGQNRYNFISGSFEFICPGFTEFV